jgi:hypothetical protein
MLFKPGLPISWKSVTAGLKLPRKCRFGIPQGIGSSFGGSCLFFFFQKNFESISFLSFPRLLPHLLPSFLSGGWRTFSSFLRLLWVRIDLNAYWYPLPTCVLEQSHGQEKTLSFLSLSFPSGQADEGEAVCLQQAGLSEEAEEGEPSGLAGEAYRLFQGPVSQYS